MRAPRLLVAALAATACTPAAPVPARTVEIPALGLAIDVPVGTAVALADDGAELVTRPGARRSRPLRVHARPPADAASERRVLAEGVTLEYAVRVESGGSGGDASTLRGALQLGERRLGVECHDQGEPPDPTWCLAWLATLRPAT